MFFLAIPAVATILETVGTVVVTTIVAEMASDAYHALKAQGDQDDES